MAEPPSTPDLDFRRFATSGDPEALARVFDATAPKLLLLARHVSRNAADAEDLVQTTFVEAMRRPEAWEPRRPVVAWLCSILAHRAADLSRRQTRRTTESLDEHEPLDAALRGPLDALLDREVADRVAESLERLPASEREVCVLRLVHGLSGEEMAHALARPHPTVRTQLRRGLARLRSLLPKSLAGAPALLGAAFDDRLVLARLRAEVLAAAPSTATAATATVALGVGGWIGVGALMKTWQWSVAAVAVVLFGATAWMLGAAERGAPAAAQQDRLATRTAQADAEVPANRAVGLVSNDASEPARRSAVVAPGGEPTVHYTGTVVAEVQDGRGAWVTGAPVEGLVVGWIPRGPGEFEAVTHTDASGRFRVADTRGPRDNQDLAIAGPSSPGDPSPTVRLRFEPLAFVAAGQERDLGELPLRSWFEGLVVEVVDSNGHGVEDVRMRLSCPPTGHEGLRQGFLSFGVRTDAQGRTKPLGLAPPGRWTVQILDLPPGLACTDDTSGAGTEVFFDAAHRRHVVRLERTHAAEAVRGRIVDERGEPVAGIPVQGTLGGPVSARSDREGRIEFLGEPGQELERLYIEPRKLLDRRGEDRFEPWQSDGSTHPVGTDDLEIVLRRIGELRLHVTGADGEPVDRFGTFDVTLLHQEGREPVMVAHEESGEIDDHPRGEAVLQSPRGDHWLVVLPEVGSPHAPAGFFRYTMPESGVLELPVRLPTAVSRTIEVVDESGRPFVGSTVELFLLYQDLTEFRGLWTAVPLDAEEPSSHFGSPRRIAEASTDESGRATITWRADASDRLMIRVRGRDHVPIEQDRLAWSRETLRLVTERGHTLRGRVTPEDWAERVSQTFATTKRTPLDLGGRSVHLRLVESGAAAPDSTRTIGLDPDVIAIRPDGTFVIPGVPEGSWAVHGLVQALTHEPFDLGTTWQIDADAVDTVFELDLSNLLPVRVHGHISLGNTDAAPKMLLVQRLETGGTRAWSRSLAAMEYELWAMPGRYLLDVFATDPQDGPLRFAWEDPVVVPPAAGDLQLDLRFLRRRLLVRVERQDGSPLGSDWKVRGPKRLGSVHLDPQPDGVWSLDPAPESGAIIQIPDPAPADGSGPLRAFELHWNPAETTIERTIRLPW